MDTASKPIWTQDDKELLEQYFSGRSTISLAEVFPQRSYHAIRHQARRMGLLKDSLYHVNRKFPPKPEFWQDWSDNLAYVLGLILTDGNIQNRPANKEVRIRLRVRDADVLEAIAQVAGGYWGVNEKEAFWRCSGGDVVRWVGEHGIHSDKLYRTFLPSCPPEHLSHLIRGIYDGDGFISTFDGRFKGVTVGLAGQPRLLQEVKHTLKERGVITTDASIHADKRCQCSSFSFRKRQDVKDFHKYIYQNAQLCIGAKKAIADSAVATI